MSQDKEQKVAVGLGEALPGDVPVLILGVPTGAWEYMKDSKTHTFDLTKVGLPLKLVMFGALTYDQVIETMDVAARVSRGEGLIDDPRRAGDPPTIGIDEPTVQ
jgi:hypothetical protein